MVETIHWDEYYIKNRTKKWFREGFFQTNEKCCFWKDYGKCKPRDIKLVTTNKRTNQLASEPNYHTTKYFSENLLAIKMKKTKVKMNKPVYLDMSILDKSKILIFEFWYDYIKAKYKTKQNYAKLISTVLLLISKQKFFYKDIANDV